MSDSRTSVSPKAPAQRLKRQYHLALGLIACLTLLSQLLVQSALRRFETDAPVMKLAGNQIKLSKEICKNAMELSLATLPERIAEKSQELRNQLTTWSSIHAALQQGDAGLQIPKAHSGRIGELFNSIDPHHAAIVDTANAMLNLSHDGEFSKAERLRVSWFAAKINTADERFAEGMEAIISQYEAEAQARLQKMRRLELLLMSITLIALLIEAVCVFRPATRMISGQIAALEKQTADLQAARLDAEAASRAKTCFLTNMSHEIRTPMTAILGFADQLRDPHLHAADQARFIDRIQQQGQHLTGLINNILDLAASESGELVINRVRCNPRQIVGDVVANLAPRAAGKKLTLSYSCRGKVPASVETDPARLRSIVTHLVDNALKFTATGGVTVALSLPDKDAERLRIDVVDTGCGISLEQQKRLFQPFMQADESLTRREGGLGVELALCKRMAQALGGDITVNSDPGNGSTFTVHLATGSLANIELVSDGGTPTPTIVAVPPDAAVGKRLLVVDDAPDIQRLLQFVLIKFGAHVDVAHNGEEGVAAVLEAAKFGQPFDLVFMDMQMPVMDGYSAAARLRELGHTLPIVAVTAHAMAGEREKCLASGCTDYCTKPIDRNRLLEMIYRYTTRRAVAA